VIPLASRVGGQGDPLLLYIHGLNANREAWNRLDSVAAESWEGRRVAVDLPGHGRSDRTPLYSYGALAAAVAATVGKSSPVSIIGHSMGGVVALALASGWFGLDVVKVLAFGVKVQWTEEELGRLRELAERPAKRFKSREEAATRFLRVSGLEGLVELDDPAVERGVVNLPEGDFALATDPAANAIGAPSIRSLVGAAQAKVRLACGSGDPLVGIEELRAHDPEAEEWGGLAHNAQVEAPEQVWETFQRLG
jgi:pimeloyl-ACP methyl ester carboxylesterase